jgi:hypothetical protein
MAADIEFLKQELINLKASEELISSKQKKSVTFSDRSVAVTDITNSYASKLTRKPLPVAASSERPVKHSSSGNSKLVVQPDPTNIEPNFTTQSPVPDGKENLEDDSQFVMKKRKHKRRVFGSGATSDDECSFTGIPRRALLYLARVKCGTTPADIIRYLNRKFPLNEFQCESLTSGDRYCSFKVNAPMKLLDDLFRSDVWPEGVYVGKFFPSKKSREVQSPELPITTPSTTLTSSVTSSCRIATRSSNGINMSKSL